MMSAKTRYWFAFAILLLLAVVLGLLFWIAKSGTNHQAPWIHFLRVAGYHSPWLVGVILAVALAFTLFTVRPALRGGYGLARPWGYGPAAAGLLLTMLPWGNWWIHGSFFYEEWMWYGALWFMGLCLSATAMGMVSSCYIAFLERWGRRFAKLDRVLHDPFLSWRDGLWIGLPAAWAVLAAHGIYVYALGNVPHIQDSLAQLFQAKVFAHGMMAAPAPPDSRFFERLYLVVERGIWYSIYPPGHSLWLALPVRLGISDWLNPLVSGAIVPAYFVLAWCFSTPFTARLGCVLMGLSPFFLMMGSEYMNHPPCLLFLLLVILLLFVPGGRLSPKRPVLLGLAAGLAAGFAYLIRPLTALAVLSVVMAGYGIRWWKHPRRIVLTTLVMAAGCAPPAVFYLMYNAWTTGSPWIPGYVHYFDANPMGFGEKPWGPHPLGPPVPAGVHHNPMRGLANTICNFNGLNLFLFGWPVPSLTLAFLLFIPGFTRRSADWFCVAAIGMVAAVYFFYFYQDYCFGPRFYYETIPGWIFLTARGIEEIHRVWGAGVRWAYPRVQGLIYGFLLISIVTAAGTTWVACWGDLCDDYWGTRDEAAAALRAGVQEENAVIFVENADDYAAVFSFLDPFLRHGWIVALDWGREENVRLLRNYPEWPVYILRLIEQGPGRPFRSVLERYPAS
ncbi:MAG TPA: hypothetical protein PLX83_01135 [bacterium]|nr:hypothetical protein [bacterium]